MEISSVSISWNEPMAYALSENADVRFDLLLREDVGRDVSLARVLSLAVPGSSCGMNLEIANHRRARTIALTY